ncbi:MAG: hypothetical protein LBT46_08340 [Planctomycetaceae bacterium]|jgi:hypothetical protein|nr:hypothetical protein [Planctomycetaceae bacterium]
MGKDGKAQMNKDKRKRNFLLPLYRVLTTVSIAAVGLIVSITVCPDSCGQVPVAVPAAVPDVPTAESVIKELSTGSQDTEKSIDSVVKSISEKMSAAPVTKDSVKSAVEGVLVVDEPLVPEVNLNAAEAVDTKTGRYPPRLKVDFNKFPLCSPPQSFPLQSSGSAAAGSGFVPDTGREVAERIKKRLCEPNLNITFKNRTATVSGAVISERKRFLAEVMLSLEPGIDRVTCSE